MSAVTYTITSDDVNLPETAEVLSISVVHEVNRISYAELVLIDGDYTTQTYKLSDSEFFNPGKIISIGLRQEDELEGGKVVFKGLVITQSLRYDQGNSLLTIEMSDQAIKMTGTKQSKVYADIKDSALIKELVNDSIPPNFMSEVKVVVDETDHLHERLVQYHTTNWDMLLSRADANGLLVTTIDGEISAKKPPLLNNVAKQDFNLAKTVIYDLDLKVDSRDQHMLVEATTWDETNHKLVKSSAANYKLQQGNLKDNTKLRKISSGDKGEQLLAPVPITVAEAKKWADARMARTRLAMLKGSFKLDGITNITLLDIISLTGMGKKFDGNTLVTGIRHEVSDGSWFTHLQFGLPSDWLSDSTQLTALPASGLIPGINGLQVAIVEKVELDTTNRARVQVSLPHLSGDSKVIWARMATPYAGNGRGMFFWPEKDDEVILGFINDDPRYPVILGSMFGSKNIPPVPRDEKNAAKGFVSREGMKIFFDDEEKQISILTSEENRIVINETKKSIEIKDINNNSINLSDAGIVIDVANNLIIRATGDVSIKGNTIKIEGNTIELK